ncbi:MAG: carotenoid oxygenase family protein [Myxococcales bacterium]|nr:carotenoid oxygenase family protein [Myxococcales bacterium]
MTQAAPTTGYLELEHTPIHRELSGEAIVVSGELPKDLRGLYVRNSPSPQFSPIGKYHWFDGDGMVHGLRFENGRATYRNRWVETRGFKAEREAGKALYTGILEPVRPEAMGLPGGPIKDTANTDLVFHRGRLFALWWLSGTPYELSTRDLSTLGPERFGKKLTGGFSAHPKVDPRTNELVFFDYSMVKSPHLRYGLVSAEGELVRYEAIEIPTPHVLHDMAITENYSILLDFPMGWDQARLAQGKMRIAFDRGTPSRFGVLPRLGYASDVRWFEAEPCYMYHTINAYEEGREIVLVGCRVRDPIPEKRDATGKVARLDSIELVPHLYEWRFDLDTGKTKERQLDDLATEFPRINDAIQGKKARYSYNPRVAPDEALKFDGLVKYDLETGAKLVWDAPAGTFVGEAAFARAGSLTGEDDGYLVTYGTSHEADDSHAFVLDARTMREVARLRLPQRIPLGFHSYFCHDHT